MYDTNNDTDVSLDELLETALDVADELDSKIRYLMRKCAVATCLNTPEKDGTTLSFYNFPSNPELRNVWFDVCDIRMPSLNIKSLKICEIHFTVEDFEQNLDSNYMKILKSNAIPSISVPVIERPPYDLVKLYVDTNDELKDKMAQLKHEQEQLLKELAVCKNITMVHKKRCIKLKDKIGKMKRNSVVVRNDKNLLSKVFSDAQIKILMGRKKVIWSDDDLAMAFSLRQISGKECYLYLKTFLNFPLPALSCVQKWVASV